MSAAADLVIRSGKVVSPDSVIDAIHFARNLIAEEQEEQTRRRR